MFQHAAPTPELGAILLRTWLGREPDGLLLARLTLMRQLTQLYAGAIILLVVPDPGAGTITDLSAPTIDEFQAMVDRGEMQVGTPAATHVFAKVMLRSFVDGLASAEVQAGLRTSAAG